MTHCHLKEKMSDLYDGELSGEERREAEAHLASCGECGAFYAHLGTLSAALSVRRVSSQDEAFVRGVMGRIPAAAAKKMSGARIVPVQWFAPLIGIAAMALLAIVPVQRTTVSAQEMITGGQDEMADFIAEES